MHIRALSRPARAFAGLIGALALALGGTLATAQQAEAVTLWKVISTKTTCTHYSFGDMCTKTTTYKRWVPYCTNPPISNPWGSMGWATYCIRYESSSWMA